MVQYGIRMQFKPPNTFGAFHRSKKPDELNKPEVFTNWNMFFCLPLWLSCELWLRQRVPRRWHSHCDQCPTLPWLLWYLTQCQEQMFFGRSDLYAYIFIYYVKWNCQILKVVIAISTNQFDQMSLGLSNIINTCTPTSYDDRLFYKKRPTITSKDITEAQSGRCA